MGVDYIPWRDADVAGWLENFAGRIAAEPARYGQSAADGARLVEVVEAYGRALAVARDPGLRTRGALAVKDEARDAAVRLCRA